MWTEEHRRIYRREGKGIRGIRRPAAAEWSSAPFPGSGGIDRRACLDVGRHKRYALPLSRPSVHSGLRSGDLDPRGRSDEMVHFVGLDVSVRAVSGDPADRD
jgi:hypothetical protein